MLKPTVGRCASLALLTVLSFVLPQAGAEGSANANPAPVKKPVAPAHNKNKPAAKSPAGAASGAKSFDAREKLVKKVSTSHGKQRVVYQRVAHRPSIPVVPAVLSAGDLAGLSHTRDPLALASNVALVIDQSSSQILFEKNANVALPIASITKLMTGLVVVEAQQDMNEILEVGDDDLDREKFTSSRLRVGAKMSRANMLHIALMSSENRAAAALSRHYPGGRVAFIAAMNARAKSLGMNDTFYVDGTGLSSRNVASASDLAKLVTVAAKEPLLGQYSTDSRYVVNAGGRPLQYANSNHLVATPGWEIALQKTGYISEAGRCLVMKTIIEGRAIVMVFLDSKGKLSRTADAGRIRKWLEANKGSMQPIVQATI